MSIADAGEPWCEPTCPAALVLGTHLHGAAADALASGGIGPVGMTAAEVIDAARRLWNHWLAGG